MEQDKNKKDKEGQEEAQENSETKNTDKNERSRGNHVEGDDEVSDLVPYVKHTSTSTIVLTVILSAIIFGAIGYWYGANRNSSTQENSEDNFIAKTQIEIAATPTRTITALETTTPTAAVSVTSETTTTEDLTSTPSI